MDRCYYCGRNLTIRDRIFRDPRGRIFCGDHCMTCQQHLEREETVRMERDKRRDDAVHPS